MTYRVKIDRIGTAGVPGNVSQFYSAKDEADATTIAAYEIDSNKPGRRRVATVTDASGRMVFTYSGRAGRAPT